MKYDIIKFVIFIFTFITALLSLPMLWNGLIAVVGVFKKRKITVKEQKQHKFAVIICARNEEKVIGKLIDTINGQSYPRELFDVFVVADNCTNVLTAKVAREHGATVYERFNTANIGKGFAMKWGFEQIFSQHPNTYDAVCVFDADNQVSRDFLAQMNNALCSGADGAQGQRRSLNPHETVVSGCYEIYWMMINLFQNKARHNLHLSSLLGGTGFVLRSELVKNGKWSTSTITEDLEFTITEIAKGRQILYVEDAVFYDEQPTDIKTSLIQRFRWAFGGIQCAKKLMSQSVKAALTNGIAAFDALMILLLMPTLALTPITTIVQLSYALFAPKLLASILLSSIGYLVLSSAVIAVLSAILVIKSKGDLKKLWRSAALYAVFILPVSFMALISLFKRDCKWTPIKHKGAKAT